MFPGKVGMHTAHVRCRNKGKRGTYSIRRYRLLLHLSRRDRREEALQEESVAPRLQQ
jgi:hypothetical protein